MGAFFTNLQVRTSDVDAVAKALRADAAARGMDEVTEADEADRNVLVLPAVNGWITVYDEATEGQDMASLEAIAVAVTKATRGHAFTAMVHDSDIADVRLFHAGERRDRLDSDPTYYGSTKPSKKKRDAVAGHAEAWSDLVDGDAERLRALAEAFRSRALFAEGIVRAVCEIVGCDPQRASLGYRYATEHFDDITHGATVLRFRARVRAAYEMPSDAPVTLETQSFPNGVMSFAVGDEVRLPFGTRSVGRAGRGLGVRTWGDALAKGLVEIERFEVIIGNIRSGAKPRTVEAVVSKDAAGAPMRVADLVDAEIPAGTSEPFGFTPGQDMHRMLDAMFRAQVHVNVIGRALAVGTGELGIGLTPLERHDGSDGTHVQLSIDAPFPVVLRARGARPSEGASSHVLRPLAGDSQLVVMAGFTTREAAARVARACIETLIDRVADSTPVAVSTYFADGTRPKVGKGKAKTMLRGAKLASIVDAMVREATVTLEAGPLALNIGTSIGGDREAERIPWLTLSLVREVRDSDEARNALSALIDEAVRRGECVQATMTRTGWDARSAASINPYETACALPYGVGTLRRWAARWLRLPGNDRMWVARDLAARVDTAAVAALADSESIGDAIRWTLRDRSQAPAFEEAIAAILPTAEQSMDPSYR